MNGLPLATKTGAAIAFSALLAALAYGWLAPSVDQGRLHVAIGWGDGGSMPVGASCGEYELLGTPEQAAAIGLTLPDGSSGYVLVRVAAADAPDAGRMDLPGSLDEVDFSARLFPCDAGVPQLEAWEASIAPWPCACAPATPDAGPPCEWLRRLIDGSEAWAPAPSSIALPPGRWRGSCQPTPCVERPGRPSLDPRCRP